MTSTRYELATLLLAHSLASQLLGATKTGLSKATTSVCATCALEGKWCNAGCNCGHELAFLPEAFATGGEVATARERTHVVQGPYKRFA